MKHGLGLNNNDTDISYNLLSSIEGVDNEAFEQGNIIKKSPQKLDMMGIEINRLALRFNVHSHVMFQSCSNLLRKLIRVTNNSMVAWKTQR